MGTHILNAKRIKALKNTVCHKLGLAWDNINAKTLIESFMPFPILSCKSIICNDFTISLHSCYIPLTLFCRISAFFLLQLNVSVNEFLVITHLSSLHISTWSSPRHSPKQRTCPLGISREYYSRREWVAKRCVSSKNHNANRTICTFTCRGFLELELPLEIG